MTTKYDDAVIALYQSPLDKFVEERKRLSRELKAGGDKAGAARLAGLGRPTISAWAVNQLFWQARDAFDELFAAGERLRGGDLGATSAHRDSIVKLRARAEALLGAAGHAATEATLRRVVTNLSALGAVGSFDPDPPGALAGDREPPGFGMVVPDAAQSAEGDVHPNTTPPSTDKRDPEEAKRRKEADAARQRQERERLEQQRRQQEEERQTLEQERRKTEQERARKQAERRPLEVALHRAKAELEVSTRQVDRLRNELAVAESALDQARSAVADIASRLAALD